MSAEAAILTRTWRVGDRTVTLTVPRPKPGKVLHALMEWSTPSPPNSLSNEEWHEYRVGRAIAISELASELRLPIAVLDLL